MQFSFVEPLTKKTLILPIPPSHMAVDIGTKVLSFEPTVLGDIELPRGRTPITFTLKGLLPGENQSISERDSELTPKEVVEQMNIWVDSKRPGGQELRFIVTETDWNIPVFLRNFAPEYSGGYGDITYTMTLTELRPFTVKEVKPQSSGKKEVRATKPKPKSYTVKKGDTLSAVAREYGGSAGKWSELWNLNRSKLKSGNPDLIYPGETLNIPAGWLT